jgi:hypothetical protein
MLFIQELQRLAKRSENPRVTSSSLVPGIVSGFSSATENIKTQELGCGETVPHSVCIVHADLPARGS